MSYLSHKRGSQRAFDHLYDPIYDTSSDGERQRKNTVSLAKTAPTTIFPIYNTMFTDLPREPRNMYILRHNPLPHNPLCADEPNCTQNRDVSIDGPDRAKYFDLPLENPKKVQLRLNIEPDCRCEIVKPEPEEPFTTIGCQTIYRESSAQTKPWMPDAIIASTEVETPEIVYIADLINTEYLPGVYEADIVERFRIRREWEKVLPSITSPRTWMQRQLILEAFEWEEWVAREKQIEDCQKLRMKIVINMVEKRKEDMKTRSTQKIANSTKRLEAERDRKLQRLRIKHQRLMRKFNYEHKNISKKYQPADLIIDHIDRASNLYAPQTRFGVHPKHNHFMAFKTDYEARLEGLHKIEPKVENFDKYMNPKEKLEKPKAPLKEVKKDLWTNKCLLNLYNSLKALGHAKTANLQSRDVPLCLQLLKTSSESVVQSEIQSWIEELYPINFNDAAVLKKYFRDCAFKDNLFISNKFKELIEEVQSFNKVTTEAKQTVETVRSIRGDRRRKDNLNRIKEHINEIIQKEHGECLSILLRFIEDEMNRLETERKEHALFLLAKKEREETAAIIVSQRESFDHAATQEEEKYRQILYGDSDLASQYLETVLLDCFNDMADADARKRMRQLIAAINEDYRNCTTEKVVKAVTKTLISRCCNRIQADGTIDKSDRDDWSSLSSLDEGESIAEHEAKRAVKRFTKKALDKIEYDNSGRAIVRKVFKDQFLHRFLIRIGSDGHIEEHLEDLDPLSILGSDVNVAHHEATRTVNRAIGKSLKTSLENQAGERIVPKLVDEYLLPKMLNLINDDGTINKMPTPLPSNVNVGEYEARKAIDKILGNIPFSDDESSEGYSYKDISDVIKKAFEDDHNDDQKDNDGLSNVLGSLKSKLLKFADD